MAAEPEVVVPEPAEAVAPAAPSESLDGPPWRRVLEALRAGEEVARPVDLRKAHLVGWDLSGLDLSGADLSGANLSRAKVRGTILMGAKLVGTVLYEAELTEAELTGADLSGANLEHARGERAGFGGARLRDAKMMQAELRQCTFTKAQLDGADARCAVLTGSRLHEASLERADFTGADLKCTNLAHTQVKGATFDEADCRDSSMTGMRGFAKASWIGADIRDINFAGAYLVRRHVMDANYIEEFRLKSRWHAVVHKIWWATSDCGRSLGRWSFWVAVQVLAFAWLYGMVEIDYGDYETPLSALYYSVVTMTTLGYGDVLPASTGAQIVAMAEVVTGYVMLGGLLSIFSNKMARRAE